MTRVLALSFLAGTAHAHHYIPRALGIEFQPNNPERVVVGALDFGLFASNDGGATWHLSCYDMLGSANPTIGTLPLLVTTTGSVLTQPGWPMMKSPANLCSAEELFVGGAADAPRGAGVRRASDGTLFGLTGLVRDDGQAVTELWRSDASGESFSPIGVPLVGSFVGRSFVLAPSPVFTAAPPPIVYAAGVVVAGDAPTEFAIARTDDLGVTWDVTQVQSPDVMVDRDLVAAAPSNPALLFARDSRRDPSEPQESIWFSIDAGASWRLLHQGEAEVPGFAFSPDGKTVALGDARSGLFHVDVASLTNADNPSVARVFGEPVWAITWNEAGLYAGLDEFQEASKPQLPTVGVSQDGGRTFAPFMTICQAQASTCAAPSEATSCFARFSLDVQVASGRCENIGSGGVGGGTGGSSAGAAGGSSGGGAPSTGGVSPSTGGAASGGTGSVDPEPEELRVTSCAMSSPGANSSPSRIAFFMLAAALVAVVTRRRQP